MLPKERPIKDSFIGVAGDWGYQCQTNGNQISAGELTCSCLGLYAAGHGFALEVTWTALALCALESCIAA